MDAWYAGVERRWACGSRSSSAVRSHTTSRSSSLTTSSPRRRKTGSGMDLPSDRRSAIHSRQSEHRRILQNGEGEPVQDTIPCDAEPIPRKDHLSGLPWHPTQEGSQLCEDWRKEHHRTGRYVDYQSQRMVPEAGADRTRAEKWASDS